MPMASATKYWHMTVFNPSLKDFEKLVRRFSLCDYVSYAHDDLDSENYILEAVIIFGTPKQQSGAQRFFRKGNFAKVSNLFEQLDSVSSYENCVSVGTHPFDEIRRELETAMEVQALADEHRQNSVLDCLEMPTPVCHALNDSIDLDLDATPPRAPKKRRQSNAQEL